MKHKFPIIFLITAFLILITVNVGNAVNKPQVAAFDFSAENVSSQVALMAVRQLRTALTNIQRMDIIEREQMERILEEQGKMLDECREDGCRIEFGRLVNADMIIIGEVSRIDNLYTLSARIIDLETGRHVVNKSIPFTASEEREILEHVPELATELSNGLKWKVLVIHVSPKGKIIVDAGLGLVCKGDTLKVKRLAEKFKHPETLEWRYIIGKVGKLKVIDVEEEQSTCSIISGVNYRVNDFIEIGGDVREVPTGAIFIKTKPLGATVKMDKLTKGKTPLTLNDVPIGKHSIEVKFQSYREVKIVTVKTKKTTTVSFKLGMQENPITSYFKDYEDANSVLRFTYNQNNLKLKAYHNVATHVCDDEYHIESSHKSVNFIQTNIGIRTHKGKKREKDRFNELIYSHGENDDIVKNELNLLFGSSSTLMFQLLPVRYILGLGRYWGDMGDNNEFKGITCHNRLEVEIHPFISSVIIIGSLSFSAYGDFDREDRYREFSKDDYLYKAGCKNVESDKLEDGDEATFLKGGMMIGYGVSIKIAFK